MYCYNNHSVNPFHHQLNWNWIDWTERIHFMKWSWMLWSERKFISNLMMMGYSCRYVFFPFTSLILLFKYEAIEFPSITEMKRNEMEWNEEGVIDWGIHLRLPFHCIQLHSIINKRVNWANAEMNEFINLNEAMAAPRSVIQSTKAMEWNELFELTQQVAATAFVH